MYLILLLTLIISFVLVAQIRRYAMRRAVFDIPNHRSSHSIPTPLGGGIAIYITYILGLATFTVFSRISLTLFFMFFFASTLLAIIGWLDDKRRIAAKWRFLIQAISVAIATFMIAPIKSIVILDYQLALGWLSYPLTIFFGIWIINLFNFMDGIDGFAATETIFVCLLGGSLCYFLTANYDVVYMAFLLASCCLGFLYWNWQPAKIFMGDTGSYMIGFTLFCLMLKIATISFSLLIAWLLLFSIFLSDATFTLIKRLLNKENVFEAHRSHAYQILIKQGYSHRKVVLCSLIANTFFLFPMACFALIWPKYAGIIFIVTIIICWFGWRKIIGTKI